MRRKFISAGLSVLVWALSCQCGVAEVVVSGTPDRVVLQANDATIQEALDALHTTFDVAIDLRGTSGRRLTGRYTGSVRQVLSHILKGENYVMRVAADGISIHLSGASASDRRAVVAASGPQPTWEGSRLSALRRGVLKRTNQ